MEAALGKHIELLLQRGSVCQQRTGCLKAPHKKPRTHTLNGSSRNLKHAVRAKEGRKLYANAPFSPTKETSQGFMEKVPEPPLG